jgi:hypothetical protein
MTEIQSKNRHLGYARVSTSGQSCNSPGKVEQHQR